MAEDAEPQKENDAIKHDRASAGHAGKHFHWLAWGCLSAIFVAGMLVATIRAEQSRWATYIGSPEAETGLAFAIQYPEGWKPASDAAGSITVMSSRPDQVTRWWYKYVRHQEIAAATEVNIEIWSSHPPSTLNSLEQETKRTISQLGLSMDGPFRRFQTQLGPALQATITLPASYKLGPGRAAIPIHLNGTLILANNRRTHKSVLVRIYYFTSDTDWERIQPTYEEIVRRVDLVEKK